MTDIVARSSFNRWYALGDIVHLVEDMAQPQHTRNDQRERMLA